MADDSKTQANPDYVFGYDAALKVMIPIAKAVADGKGAKEAPKGQGTHIDKVEITISGNDEPSRVARIVEQRLSELSRNPRASRYTPNYSGSR